MHLRDLLAEAVGGVPQAAAGRCVHERASVATCQRCVTACPRDAWHLDDEELMVDIGRCDGCGLCVAACPEGALSQPGVSPESYAGAAELRLSCEHAQSGADDWQLRCVHAVGLAWLAMWYRAGLKSLVLQVGDCQSCERHNGNGLTESVRRLNNVLAQRGLPRIAVHVSDRGAGAVGRGGQTLRQGEPALSRRGFLRRIVSAATLPVGDQTEAAPNPPGQCLPPARSADLALFVPQIDGQRCSGCDACVRVCGHAALTCERGSSDRYVLAADLCTGCGLCVDICDRDAISVREGAVVGQTDIPLAVGQCRVCGIRFHRPDTGLDNDSLSLCQVCASVNHKRNLYQVL